MRGFGLKSMFFKEIAQTQRNFGFCVSNSRKTATETFAPIRLGGKILYGSLCTHTRTHYTRLFTLKYADWNTFSGCLNKVFMFDKGSTFLSIFGLPGYKHENDCARALQCSEKIKDDMESVARVQ